MKYFLRTIIILFLLVKVTAASEIDPLNANEVDHPPQFPGGIEQLCGYLNTHSSVHYSEAAYGGSAPLAIELIIDTAGIPVSVKVYQSGSPEVEGELKKNFPINIKWQPGLKNSKPVIVRETLLIYYQQNQNNIKNDGKMPIYIVFIVVGIIILVAMIQVRFPGKKNGLITFGIFDKPGSGFFRQRLTAWQEKQLLTHFKPYTKLSTKERRKFGDRVIRFIHDKTFEGRHELEVTDQMKLLISATAIHVSFGLRSYLFPSFNTFILFPGVFYSRVSGRKVRGETHGMGVIAFSWKDYLFGLSDENDNLNLGYHEFGHALFIERFRSTADVRFMDNYDKWRKEVLVGGKLNEATLKKTFRDYASYNEHEFFAVAVENFYEKPQKFRDDLPGMYQIMTRMMNQDPLG